MYWALSPKDNQLFSNPLQQPVIGVKEKKRNLGGKKPLRLWYIWDQASCVCPILTSVHVERETDRQTNIETEADGNQERLWSGDVNDIFLSWFLSFYKH